MLQFTIRDLLLITVIVALYVGWVADRRDQRARIDLLESQMKSGTTVNYQIYQRFSGRRDGLPISTEY